MMAWGFGADVGRRATRWLLVALAVATLVLLSTGYGSAEARAAEQGTYCWRIGRRLNQNGDVAGATWSEDGGETWLP